MADSLANLDLGGLAEGVPDEAVVVPLTELDMVVCIVEERAKSDKSTVNRLFRGNSWVSGLWFEISTTQLYDLSSAYASDDIGK